LFLICTKVVVISTCLAHNENKRKQQEAQGMKHYGRLLQMGCFTRKDLTQMVGGENTAGSLIYSYKKKGLIKSVRRNLFVAISLETGQPVASRFSIASHAAPDAVVSHHSAFEYHGYANQVYYEMYVTAQTRFRSFEYDGISYRCLSGDIDHGVLERPGGVRVSDIERTVLDSINDFERVGGLEELLRCLEMVPCLDAEKLLGYLAEYDTGYLYQKAGYILEHLREALYLPDSFFDSCKGAIPKTKRYLYKGLQKQPHVLSADWRLYVPAGFAAITDKRVGVDGRI
jgi:predicted transcriptional regulator of viral defense system